MHHASLIVIQQNTDYLNYIKQMIFDLWTTSQVKDFAFYQDKLKNNNYADFIVYDGISMKKQDSLELQNRYLNEGLEAIGHKFYVITNIHKTSTLVLNSLLKFIEQPPENTFCFLVTNQLWSVLPTIRSRCQIHFLHSQKYDKTNEQELAVFNDYELYLKFKNNNYLDMFAEWFTEIKDSTNFGFFKEEFKKQTHEVLFYFLKYLFVFGEERHRADIYEWLTLFKNLNFNKTSLLILISHLFY
ncbi:DNA polymerase III subunit [Ureaplasma sp. ES3154-GEN]|uniref:DNA polymerase III subunit n=1 Tax=Ureaplasma sp. ES3154-GEN TaxID=2984844 RepID=UPI0021E774AE|nr:DNA polymerase III subunit [Ureaplasma sp. ES3154-GEN]MCV3743745.1 DNA polymerase III subunit [Ureaplasma sp. ES3154-GEN]